MYLFMPHKFTGTGRWENINNPDFKPIEFERFKNEAGNNSNEITDYKCCNKEA